MSGPQGTYLIPGFGYVPYSGFWGPVGDIYPRTPVWTEYHTPQGLGADSAAAADLYQNIIVPYGIDYVFTIDLTDIASTPVDTSDDLPAGNVGTGYVYSRVTSSVSAPFGWAQSRTLSVVPSGGGGNLWDGTLIVTIPITLQSFLGFNQSCPFSITLYMADRSSSVEYRVDVMYGDIVVRR